MPVKLFILGLPGSGKSAIARYLSTKHYAEGRHWTVRRFNDYKILDDKFHQDTAGQFKSADSGGFDVLDLKVFDEALQALEKEVKNHIDSPEENANELVLIEFSRNNYKDAFKLFDTSFLQNAYFLYLSTEIEVCKERICYRVAHPEFKEDDHPVSEYIFEAYYNHDDGRVIAQMLEQYFLVSKEHVLTIDNNGSLEVICRSIEPFIYSMINSFSVLRK